MKYCQGPLCHTYDTKDRKRGPKGNKVNQTRRRSSFYYGNGNFCSLNCQNDWFNDFGDRAIDYFGRLTEPKKLEEEVVFITYKETRVLYNVKMIGLNNLGNAP